MMNTINISSNIPTYSRGHISGIDCTMNGLNGNGFLPHYNNTVNPHLPQYPTHRSFSVPRPSYSVPCAGGINSVLDYDLDNMSKFILWCGFGMLKQSRLPSPQFENSIKSVLFATRLPQSTIIIALEYLNQRFLINPIGDYLNENEIFTFIITALILANKFNDDNTFTNKSWHGATGLPLSVLNYHESSWLSIVEWNLNVVNFELNIRTLQQCCDTWMLKCSSEPKSPLSNCMSPYPQSQSGNYSCYLQQMPPMGPHFVQQVPVPGPQYHHGYNHCQYYSSPVSAPEDMYDYSPYEPAYYYRTSNHAISYPQNGIVGYANPYYNVAF